MKDSVTTGEDLNSYQGNAALAGTGNDVGYAKIDISPLETYALKKYETNYRDYEQQQQDKKDLEKQFTDPKLFVPLDKHYAEQINPKLERLQELSKSNLEMNPNSHDWYEFKDLYNEIIKDNAQAKTVQTMKDNAKEAMGKSAYQHEKESLNAYIQQLDQHKIGEDVPVYNKYFAPVDAHLPNLETKTGQIERINGNTIEKVKTTVYNPMNADVLAQRNLVSTPEAANTYADIAHTLLENGGIEDVNKSLADVYTKGLRLNIDDLKNKYSKEYTSYLKTNPNGSFQNFLDDTGKANELHNIRDGHQYLKEPLEYVPASVDGGRQLAGYTYITDPEGNMMRLNKPDYQVAAIYAATHKPPGAKEEVIESKASAIPSQIAENKAQAEAAAKNAETNRIKAVNEKQHWQGELGFKYWKEKQAKKTDEQNGYWLNDQTTSLINDAKKGTPEADGDFKGEYKSGSKDLKELFTIEQIVNGKKTEVVPSAIYITPDNKIRAVYKKKDENNKEVIDTELSQPISADEAKARIAEHQFGKNSQKVLEQSNEVLTKALGKASLNDEVDNYYQLRNPEKKKSATIKIVKVLNAADGKKYYRGSDGKIYDKPDGGKDVTNLFE